MGIFSLLKAPRVDGLSGGDEFFHAWTKRAERKWNVSSTLFLCHSSIEVIYQLTTRFLHRTLITTFHLLHQWYFAERVSVWFIIYAWGKKVWSICLRWSSNRSSNTHTKREEWSFALKWAFSLQFIYKITFSECVSKLFLSIFPIVTTQHDHVQSVGNIGTMEKRSKRHVFTRRRNQSIEVRFRSLVEFFTSSILLRQIKREINLIVLHVSRWVEQDCGREKNVLYRTQSTRTIRLTTCAHRVWFYQVKTLRIDVCRAFSLSSGKSLSAAESTRWCLFTRSICRVSFFIIHRCFFSNARRTALSFDLIAVEQLVCLTIRLRFYLLDHLLNQTGSPNSSVWFLLSTKMRESVWPLQTRRWESTLKPGMPA